LGELTVIGGVTISGAILIAGSFSNPRQLLAQAVKAALVRDGGGSANYYLAQAQSALATSQSSSQQQVKICADKGASRFPAT
jgi:hypothetical protein